MKRRILALLMSTILVITLLPVSTFAADTADTFVDTKDHWAEDAISKWKDYGIVGGKGNNEFDPDGLLTRGEAAQIFTNLLGLNKEADLSSFTDVEDTWYTSAIKKCYAAGIMGGKGGGIMDPEGKVTREEFFTMFARAICISDGKTPTEATTYLSELGLLIPLKITLKTRL